MRATSSSAAPPRRCRSCLPAPWSGTASLRRQAIVKRLRPDLDGGADSRQCRHPVAQARRGRGGRHPAGARGPQAAGLTHAPTSIFSVDEFLPAVGQGIVAIETRADDSATRTLLDAVNHAETATALAAERAFLAVLDGSCRTPIAGHAVIAAGRLRLRGLIAKPDGSESFECSREGPAGEAVALGHDAGAELKRRAPAPISSQPCDPCGSWSPGRSRMRNAPRRRCALPGMRSRSRRCCASSPFPAWSSAPVPGRPWWSPAANALRALESHPRRAALLGLAAVRGRPAHRRRGPCGRFSRCDGGRAAMRRSWCGACASDPGREPLLYLAGHDRSRDLAADLAADGQIVSTVVVYRAVKLEQFPPAIAAALAAGADRRRAALLAPAARRPISIARARPVCSSRAWRRRTICVSSQVAEPLVAAGAKRVHIASRPEEGALLALVECGNLMVLCGLCTFPGRGAARSAAPLSRDRSTLGAWNDPGSAAHHQVVVRCAREKSNGRASAQVKPSEGPLEIFRLPPCSRLPIC